MKSSDAFLYRLANGLVRAALGFYFRRIERFHPENVPPAGPVLFASNHPNSLTDALVIGTSVPRKVNFIATVQLFRLRPLRWLLEHCGVIAINRLKDDPRGMRSVLDTFEACFRVLERGEAVGIFPEGVTHDDPQLKPVKTGAARMALELEQRHEGKLGLRIVPVGLTFSAKEVYRSAALVNFGQPICVASFLLDYASNRHQGIARLSEEIERQIQALILHLPNLEQLRVVEAVKRLYLDRLWVGNQVIHEPAAGAAGELVLTQTIAAAVEREFRDRPERAREFVRKLDHFEWLLKRLHFSDEMLVDFPRRRGMAGRILLWASAAFIGAPIACYGWVHRLVPYLIVQAAVRRFCKDSGPKTPVATTKILSGLVAFTGFYALCVIGFRALFGWRAAIWYAASLPVASLWAHYYVRNLRRLGAGLRAAFILARAPAAVGRLAAARGELMEMVEAERKREVGIGGLVD
jgi:glycerol-3-phosphate O-acyltransferase / dihydroxyacetone phosphate acyltransferase